MSPNKLTLSFVVFFFRLSVLAPISPSRLREDSWLDGLLYLSLCRRNVGRRSLRKCSHRGTWPGWCAVHRSLHSGLRHCCLVGREKFRLMKIVNRSYSTIYCPVVNLHEVVKVFTWTLIRWVAGPTTCLVSQRTIKEATEAGEVPSRWLWITRRDLWVE